MTTASPLCLSMLLASGAVGQSVTVSVAHDDPDGRVWPGQAVTITLQISHSGFDAVSAWRGSARVTGDAGVAQNPTYWVASVYHTPGVLQGGSVTNADFFGPPSFFVAGLNLPWTLVEFEFMRYTWIAPSTPGVLEFRWEPDPLFPLVRGFPSSSSLILTPYPTTYLGTTLTVIPAPAGVGALAIGGVALGRRRR